jgi:hypothetical protein
MRHSFRLFQELLQLDLVGRLAPRSCAGPRQEGQEIYDDLLICAWAALPQGRRHKSG